MIESVTLSDYPHRTFDKLRYADTDRQGHVNNAVFATFLETGRVDVLFNASVPLVKSGAAFVIARLEMDFRSEIVWPGTVEIGTAVESVGRSSFKLRQVLFQNNQCAALAHTVIVLMNEQTRRSQPLSPEAIDYLTALTPVPTEPPPAIA